MIHKSEDRPTLTIIATLASRRRLIHPACVRGGFVTTTMGKVVGEWTVTADSSISKVRR
ncbi:hypothetical protein [uncultured Corynebacterium sp.]|uniref:hypothetical protein n=1 Tax=uncultured Corynebacterium sp. TaxID=159447 RepID=UPI0028F11724|nr:hypothetical protein [uncultured Corynebacterium sp.]